MSSSCGGSNAREAHPIFFHHLLKGVHSGAKLYTVDPRRTSSAQWSDLWLGLDVGTDIALANAVGREILEAGLENRAFIDNATIDFEAYKESVQPYTLEYAEATTGLPRESIRELAHAYAKADRAQLCWTLGITEHHNATDNVLALINLALLTGHVGRWGSGVVPLRGQNNVQGGGDMGALPNKFPGFQDVENPEHRAKFEKCVGRESSRQERAAPLHSCSKRWSGASSPVALCDRREPRAVRSRRRARDETAPGARSISSSRTCS